MKRAVRKISDYFSSNFEVFNCSGYILCDFNRWTRFYRAIILMLEFIVIMEVVKMISDFIKKETLRLRFVIDILLYF